MKEFLDLSPSEKRGLTILIILICLVQIARVIIPKPNANEATFSQSELALVEEWEKQLKASIKENTNTKNARKSQLKIPETAFDPNTYAAQDWQNLGFTEKQTSAILNYKRAIGGFKTQKDVEKIFCMPKEFFVNLKPMILLPEKIQKPTLKKAEKTKVIQTPLNIELNSADSLSILQLKGIGPYWTKRILKFRNQWGGFYKKEQLLEMKGFKDSVFQKIKDFISVDTSLIQKIPINSISFEEFKKHPLAWYGVGKSIVNYRDQHGAFQSIEDLKKIYSLKPQQVEVLSRYIEYK